MNSLTPSRVWLLAWPLPTLPVPIPTNETWIPVLPSVTMSVGPLGSRDRSRAAWAVVVVIVVAASAAVAETAVWAMKSRRFRGGVMTSVSLVPMFGSTHQIVQLMPGKRRNARIGSRWSAQATPRGDVTAILTGSDLLP